MSAVDAEFPLWAVLSVPFAALTVSLVIGFIYTRRQQTVDSMSDRVATKETLNDLAMNDAAGIGDGGGDVELRQVMVFKDDFEQGDDDDDETTPCSAPARIE